MSLNVSSEVNEGDTLMACIEVPTGSVEGAVFVNLTATGLTGK